MWRMIRAAILGVTLGVVGGAIVGQLYYANFLKNNKDKEENLVSALVYSENANVDMAEDVIRLDVQYEGKEELSDNKYQELTNAVREAVIYALINRMGKDYNEEMSFSDVKHEIIMAYEYINECAYECAMEYGIDAECQTKLEYLYFEDEVYNGIEFPAGYYETLSITLYD